MGAIIFWLERWVEEGPVEVALSLIVAYLSYFTGEAVHASGVISVVVCGLFLSRESATTLSPQSRLQATSFWDALEFLLNGLVFLLIGLQLSYVLAAIHGLRLLRLCLYGLAFSGLLIALRLIWMYPAAHIAHAVRTRWLGQRYPAPTPGGIFVLGWTGMRGVVALAAAGSLPATLADGRPLPQRNLIVFLTFSVILVTLVLQGLSLPALIRRFGFEVDRQPQLEELKARRLLLGAAVDFLEGRRAQFLTGEQHAIDDLLHEFRDMLGEFDGVDPSGTEPVTARDLLNGVYQCQRDELIKLRDRGRVGDGVYRTLERELDLGESRLASQR